MTSDEAMTTMRVSRANRDALARLAESKYRVATLDEALGSLLLEHRLWRAERSGSPRVGGSAPSGR